MKTFSIILVVALMAAPVLGDMYMHFPPGCNDRNRERNENRNNGNRLFDSQNNAKGGYPWRGDGTVRAMPDPSTYYVGSILRLEYTSQHGCGPNENIHCQVVLQYACDDTLPGLRDGYPDSGSLVQSDNNNEGYWRREFSGEAGQNADGTNTIPSNQYADDEERRNDFYYQGGRGGVEFGMHEGYDWYKSCTDTQRNKGLYLADQNLNRNDARATRQNPNGGRRGLECPEERDYYPYWRPTPWRDIGVLTSSISHCEFMQENSQNVKDFGWCDCDAACKGNAENGKIPISSEACVAAGGSWEMRAALGGGKPACQVAPFSRDNHLGNAARVDGSSGALQTDFVQPETAYFNWEIPASAAGRLCVVRMRYNMSTMDYPSSAHFTKGAEYADHTWNCPKGDLEERHRRGEPNEDDLARDDLHCVGLFNEQTRPLFHRPYINLFGDSAPKLGIAINTNQASRTFQDRSYVFRVSERPSFVDGKVWNLGARGRRGNIVQAYPAVEYDFVPNVLDVTEGEWIAVQFHGSDFNTARNANNGEGWQYSDRFNMCQFNKLGDNFPTFRTQIGLFGSAEANYRFCGAEQFGLGDATSSNTCGEFFNGDNGDAARNEENNARTNCGKLNQAKNLVPANPEHGLIRVSQSEGQWSYGSTRNNNFSNRSQKAQIRVTETGLSPGEIAAISFGAIAGVGLVAGGVLFYGKKNPHSAAGSLYSKTASCCSCCGGSTAGKTAAAAPDLDYQRS